MKAIDGANPVVPAAWEALVLGISAAILLLLVTAVIALARTRMLTGLQRLGLLAACLALPVLGPVLTLVLLYRLHRVQRAAGSAAESGDGRRVPFQGTG